MERVTPWMTPLKVTVYVPEGALFGNENVAFVVTAEPDKLTDDGDIEHVVFAGPPQHLIDTVPVNPLTGATVTV